MKRLPKRLLYPVLLFAFGAILAGCGGNPTFTVNSTNDVYDGACNSTHCSLREAVIMALAKPTLVSTIKFNIGGGGAQTIHPTSALPAVTIPMVIDGTTQPGYSTVPLIEIDGSAAGAGAIDGLRLEGGGSTVKALIINRFTGNGIRIVAPGGNKIYSNYIGTNAAGTTAMGNQGNGIRMDGDGNHIGAAGGAGGGPAFGLGNIISGNLGCGVLVDSGGKNYIQGNVIGLDATGTAPLGNHADGIAVNTDLVDISGNFVADNWGDGVKIRGGWTDTLYGNYIGTNFTGSAALGNHLNGVNIIESEEIAIGGSEPGNRNVISGNQLLGVLIDEDSTKVEVYGNYIGTNAAGTAALKNIKSGIRVSGTNHAIGASGKGNLISGNGGAGIAVVSPATGITIQDNKIGTDAAGALALGNDIGIEIGLSQGAYDVLIGGEIYGEGNLISGNLEEGLLLYNDAEVYGNRIGMDQTGLNELPNGGDGILIKGDNNLIGTPHKSNSIAHNGGHGVAVITESGSATGNFIDGNNIWDNAGLGIALAGDAVLANDPGDPDTGDNNRQNYPVMTDAIHDSATDTTTVVAGLDSAPLTTYTVEFFTNTACDPSGYGEGEQMVASGTVTTDAGGHADAADFYEPYHFIAGGYITATATDPDGNTSGFSNCIPITEKGAATNTPTGMVFEPFVNPPEIFYGNCEPNAVEIAVEISNPPQPIGYVLLFARMKDITTGELMPWTEGLTMISAGTNRYRYTLSAFDLPDYEKSAEAWLQYQFVVYDASQNKIGFSEVFWNVTVKRCGRPAGTVPTATPRGPHIGP